MSDLRNTFGRPLDPAVDTRLGAVWVEGHSGIRWRVVELFPHHAPNGLRVAQYDRFRIAPMDNPGLPGYRGRFPGVVAVRSPTALDGPEADLPPAEWFDTCVRPTEPGYDWAAHGFNWHAEPDTEYGRWTLTLLNRDEVCTAVGGTTPDDPGSDVMLLDTPTGAQLVIPLGCTLTLSAVSGWRVFTQGGRELPRGPRS